MLHIIFRHPKGFFRYKFPNPNVYLKNLPFHTKNPELLSWETHSPRHVIFGDGLLVGNGNSFLLQRVCIGHPVHLSGSKATHCAVSVLLSLQIYIYIHINTYTVNLCVLSICQNKYIYIYVYIYICVCVCCVYTIVFMNHFMYVIVFLK